MSLFLKEIEALLAAYDDNVWFIKRVWPHSTISEVRDLVTRHKEKYPSKTHVDSVFTFTLLRILRSHHSADSSPQVDKFVAALSEKLRPEINAFNLLIASKHLNPTLLNNIALQVQPEKIELLGFLKSLISGIQTLEENGLANEKYINALVKKAPSSHPAALAKAYALLHAHQLLDLFNEQINSNYTQSIDLSLHEMKRRNQLNQQNIELLIALSPSQEIGKLKVAIFIATLAQREILHHNAPHLKKLSSQELDSFIDAFNVNHDVAVIYFNELMTHAEPVKLVKMLSVIHSIDANFLATHPTVLTQLISMPGIVINNLLTVLNSTLKESKLDRLTVILEHADKFLDSQVVGILARIPAQFNTAALFTPITTILTTTQLPLSIKIRNLHDFVNHAINQGRAAATKKAEAKPKINYSQSTHNAKVHQTASESALRLKALFGEHITGEVEIISTSGDAKVVSKLELQLNKIKQWGETLGTTKNEETAKRAIKRLCESTYKDPQSQIEIRELFALTWLTINSLTPENMVTAKQNLILGLVDVQREYTLDDKGNDLAPNSDDIKSCEPAPFNKFIEKLVGLHPAAILEIVTPAQAILRANPVIHEEISKFLFTLPASERNKFLSQLEQNSTTLIWHKVKKSISDKLYSEFKSCFSSVGFESLIDSLKLEIAIDVKRVRNQILDLHFRQIVRTETKAFLLSQMTADRLKIIKQIETDGDIRSIYPEIISCIKKFFYEYPKELQVQLDIEKYIAKGNIIQFEKEFYDELSSNTIMLQLFPRKNRPEIHSTTKSEFLNGCQTTDTLSKNILGCQ